MLTRVTGVLFQAPAGSQVEIAAESQSNNGVEDARFEYDSAPLPRRVVQGLPGCFFTVLPGIRQFQAIVAFDPAAPVAARYDLSQTNTAGGLDPLSESVTPAASAPLIGFGIRGLTPGPSRAKKTTARKTRARKATRKRPATKRPATKRPAKKGPTKKRAAKRLVKKATASAQARRTSSAAKKPRAARTATPKRATRKTPRKGRGR